MQAFLIKARASFSEVLPAKKKIRDRAAVSRGRSRDRKKRRRKDKGKRNDGSDASSSSSSNKRREAVQDLAAVAEKTLFKDISLERFPSAKMATKTMSKCKAGAALSSEPIEKWVPQYVGSELASAAQKKVVAEREKSESMTLAQLLESSSAFWLTHGVAGKVTPVSVLRHLLLLVKMASKRSAAVAVQYERTLLQHIRNQKGSPDADAMIVDIVATS